LIKIPYSSEHPFNCLSTYPYYLKGMNNCELLNVVYVMSEQDPEDDFWFNHDNSNEEVVNIFSEEKVGQLIIKDYYDIVIAHTDFKEKYHSRITKEQCEHRMLHIDNSFNKLLELSKDDRTDLVVKKMSEMILSKYQYIYNNIVDAMTFKLID